MNTPIRLALYALLLAVVFGVAIGAGRLVGPALPDGWTGRASERPSATTAPTSGDHQSDPAAGPGN